MPRINLRFSSIIETSRVINIRSITIYYSKYNVCCGHSTFSLFLFFCKSSHNRSEMYVQLCYCCLNSTVACVCVVSFVQIDLMCLFGGGGLHDAVCQSDPAVTSCQIKGIMGSVVVSRQWNTHLHVWRVILMGGRRCGTSVMWFTGAN